MQEDLPKRLVRYIKHLCNYKSVSRFQRQGLTLMLLHRHLQHLLLAQAQAQAQALGLGLALALPPEPAQCPRRVN